MKYTRMQTNSIHGLLSRIYTLGGESGATTHLIALVYLLADVSVRAET